MKLLVSALVTLLTTAAFAKSATQYQPFYQPSASQSALDLRYRMYSRTDAPDVAGSTDTKLTANDLMIDYGYGLSEMTTVGLRTFNGAAKTEFGTTSTTASGFGDVYVYYKGQMDVWHYGADLGYSIEKQKAGSNRSSGGLTLDAYGGGLWTSNMWNYGFNLSVSLPQEQKTEKATGTGKSVGGMMTKLAAIGEYNYGMGMVGGELGYNLVADTTISSDLAGTADVKAKAYNFMDVMLYATYDFNDMFTGTLSYQMDMIPSRDLGGVSQKAMTASTANLGVRISF